MKTELWPEKDPAEKVWATFAYAPALEASETIQSAALTVSLKQGSDATPAAILDGAAVLLAGGRVMQRIQGGVNGASYLVRCAATTSTGRVLLLAGVVPVVEIV